MATKTAFITGKLLINNQIDNLYITIKFLIFAIGYLVDVSLVQRICGQSKTVKLLYYYNV